MKSEPPNGPPNALPQEPARNPASLALLSDEVLMNRIGEGDAAAYAALMDRHLDRSLGMATRILKNRSEAEEALQEAFLRLWKTAPSWTAEGARFSTWFYRVVVNLCIDIQRRRKAPHLDLADAPEIADEGPRADEALAKADERAALRAAVEALPERQRLAVELCYFEGLSNREAAEVLDVNVKALESLLSRGRTALKQHLAEQAGGNP